jgi:hypothetical protein
MAWTYSQTDGKLYAPDGTLAGIGYSGHGDGVNNPGMDQVPDVGPIPSGAWTIGEPFTDPEKGPLVMALTPQRYITDRSGFLMHGDLVTAVGQRLASHGCIIMGHAIRFEVAASPDRLLNVVAQYAP